MTQRGRTPSEIAAVWLDPDSLLGGPAPALQGPQGQWLGWRQLENHCRGVAGRSCGPTSLLPFTVIASCASPHGETLSPCLSTASTLTRLPDAHPWALLSPRPYSLRASGQPALCLRPWAPASYLGVTPPSRGHRRDKCSRRTGVATLIPVRADEMNRSLRL